MNQVLLRTIYNNDDALFNPDLQPSEESGTQLLGRHSSGSVVTVVTLVRRAGGSGSVGL